MGANCTPANDPTFIKAWEMVPSDGEVVITKQRIVVTRRKKPALEIANGAVDHGRKGSIPDDADDEKMFQSSVTLMSDGDSKQPDRFHRSESNSSNETTGMRDSSATITRIDTQKLADLIAAGTSPEVDVNTSPPTNNSNLTSIQVNLDSTSSADTSNITTPNTGHTSPEITFPNPPPKMTKNSRRQSWPSVPLIDEAGVALPPAPTPNPPPPSHPENFTSETPASNKSLPPVIEVLTEANVEKQQQTYRHQTNPSLLSLPYNDLDDYASEASEDGDWTMHERNHTTTFSTYGSDDEMADLEKQFEANDLETAKHVDDLGVQQRKDLALLSSGIVDVAKTLEPIVEIKHLKDPAPQIPVQLPPKAKTPSTSPRKNYIRYEKFKEKQARARAVTPSPRQRRAKTEHTLDPQSPHYDKNRRKGSAAVIQNDAGAPILKKVATQHEQADLKECQVFFTPRKTGADPWPHLVVTVGRKWAWIKIMRKALANIQKTIKRGDRLGTHDWVFDYHPNEDVRKIRKELKLLLGTKGLLFRDTNLKKTIDESSKDFVNKVWILPKKNFADVLRAARHKENLASHKRATTKRRTTMRHKKAKTHTALSVT